MVELYLTVGVLCFFAGMLFGVRVANQSWVQSACEGKPALRTAHHYGGKFFYVIPETEFCNEYERKRRHWR